MKLLQNKLTYNIIIFSSIYLNLFGVIDEEIVIVLIIKPKQDTSGLLHRLVDENVNKEIVLLKLLQLYFISRLHNVVQHC